MSNLEKFVGRWTVKYMEVLDDNGKSERITLEQLREMKDEFPAEEYANEVETFKFVIDINNGMIRIMHPHQEDMSNEEFVAASKNMDIKLIEDMIVLQESSVTETRNKISFYGFMNQPMMGEIVDDMLYIEAMGMFLVK